MHGWLCSLPGRSVLITINNKPLPPPRRPQGIYSNVVPTEGHYWSDSYRDDLAFAACWLYRASGTQQYLKDCEMYWAEHYRLEGPASQSVEWNYNHMIPAVDAMLYQMTNKAAYKAR